MTCVVADGCLRQGGGECAQRPWSVVALGVEKKSTVYSPAPAVVNSEGKLTSTGNCNETHTPRTASITVGIQQHMQDAGMRPTTDECKLFTVFLIAVDVSTSASLTTTTSQTLYCVLGMQITRG